MGLEFLDSGQGWLVVQLAVCGVFGAIWSFAGTRLVRNQGVPALAMVGYGATAVSFIFAIVLLIWGFTR